jgi:hypothetical protein
MRKENFSLKLKIFFMSDRLTKLAPEHIQAVLKEVHTHSSTLTIERGIQGRASNITQRTQKI